MRRLKCFLGFHDWRYFSGSSTDLMQWWKCAACGNTNLRTFKRCDQAATFQGLPVRCLRIDELAVHAHEYPTATTINGTDRLIVHSGYSNE